LFPRREKRRMHIADAFDLLREKGNLSSDRLMGALSIGHKPDSTLHCKPPRYATDWLLES